MAAIDPWLTALAARATTPARVMVWGDSRAEGQGATTLANRWQSKFAAGMRAAFPTTGVTTYAENNYAAFNLISTSLASLTLWTGKTVASSPNNFGLGTRCSILSAAGQGATLPFTGTAFKLAYVASNVASSFSYTVDGGAPVTVSWPAGSVADGRTVTVTGLADTSHTVVVAWLSGTVYIEGAHQFRGEYAKGIQVFDAGHSGTRSGTTYGASRTYMTQSTATVNPHLIIVVLGTNDFGGSIVPATYRTEMEANITAWRAGCTTPPTIVLTLDWERGPTIPAQAYPWADYLQQLRDIAAADTGVMLFDLQAQFPNYTDNATGYIAADDTHETDAGQARRAQLVQAAVSPVQPTLRVLRASVTTTRATLRLRVLRAAVTTSGQATLRVLRAAVATESAVQANAGAPTTVDSLETVILSAAASSGNPTGYLWTQTAGPTVALRPSGAVPRPEFTAPATDAGTTVTFSLAVTSGGTTSTNTATATVTVRPHIDWMLAANGTTWVPVLTDVII